MKNREQYHGIVYSGKRLFTTRRPNIFQKNSRGKDGDIYKFNNAGNAWHFAPVESSAGRQYFKIFRLIVE